MNAEELRKLLIERGYDVRSIRVFKKSFHVNVWTDETKERHFYKESIEKLTELDAKRLYPKVA